MAEDEASGASRKAKKAQRDAERASKFRDKGGKKRKANAVVEDESNAAALTEDATEPSKPVDDLFVIDTVGEDPAPVSKKHKAKHEKAQEGESKAVEESASKKRKSDGEKPDGEKPEKNTKKRKTDGTDAKNSKFIVFIGNLPYTSTSESIDKHFERLKPYTLRHLTDAKNKKSKGYCFLEFEDYDRMKTCLKIYHHSVFDPENPGLLEPEAEGEEPRSRKKKRGHGRKINVELTAGGGGNKAISRKEKIKAKNIKLNEERMRRAAAMKKERVRKDRKAAVAEQETVSKPAPVASSGGGIHPSRLARISNN